MLETIPKEEAVLLVTIPGLQTLLITEALVLLTTGIQHLHTITALLPILLITEVVILQTAGRLLLQVDQIIHLHIVHPADQVEVA
jgi:hypothetical protein